MTQEAKIEYLKALAAKIQIQLDSDVKLTSDILISKGLLKEIFRTIRRLK